MAIGGVDDLGVKLDAVDASLGVLDRGDRRGGRGGERGEAVRRLKDGVPVRHPAGLLARHPGEQQPRLQHAQIRAPELAHLRLLDAAAELLHEQLHAVADAEHRDPELQQTPVQPGRALGGYRGRPPREDDPARGAPGKLVRRCVVRQQLAEDAAVAQAAGDQLAVLPPVVEDHDLLDGRVRPRRALTRRRRRGHQRRRGAVTH